MISITRAINDWTQAKFNAIDVNSTEHPYLQAFGLGMIEGAVDTLVVIGAVSIVAGVIDSIKQNK